MKQLRNPWLPVTLLMIFWAGSASSAMVGIGAVAVESPGGSSQVNPGASPGDPIRYYIPIGPGGLPGGSLPGGTYGVDTVGCGTAGQCIDSGTGAGYAGADALFMNLFFDLSLVPESADASLDIWFKDLDLDPINDPEKFFESVSVSYWNVGADTTSSADDSLVSLGPVVTQASQLTAGFSGASTDLPASPLGPSNDPFTWSLDLTLLGLDILDELNDSQQQSNGFWIRLGFGSDFSGKHGTNTKEYLSATLNVSPVPLPSAVWLFGSALLGFIGLSRRTRV